jgi:hypothetical protein
MAKIVKDINPLRLGAIRLSASGSAAVEKDPPTYRRLLTYLLKMLQIEYEDRFRLINDKADKTSPQYHAPTLAPPAWMDGPQSIGDAHDAVARLKDQVRKFFQCIPPFHVPLRHGETTKDWWIRLDADPEAQPLAVWTIHIDSHSGDSLLM